MRKYHYNLPSLVTCHLQENKDVTELDKVFPKSLVINFGCWTMMGELSNRMARLAPLLIPCVNQSVYFQSQSAILSLFSTTTVSQARARVRERGTYRDATHLKISWFLEKRLPQNIVQTPKKQFLCPENRAPLSGNRVHHWGNRLKSCLLFKQY